MSQSESDQNLERHAVDEGEVVYRFGDQEFHVHVDRTYRLHGHFGEFKTLEQVEEVIRKIAVDR